MSGEVAGFLCLERLRDFVTHSACMIYFCGGTGSTVTTVTIVTTVITVTTVATVTNIS